jgi:hypothetical protein
MKQDLKRIMPMLAAAAGIACTVGIGGCGGGGSSGSTSSQTTTGQYTPRQAVTGDERVYQVTDTYDDGTTSTYTQRRVVSQSYPNGVSTTQAFDANGNLLQIDSIDVNHQLSVTSYSAGVPRVCVDQQPRPAFATPYTVGETYQGNYSTGCIPDGLTADVQTSGKIAAVEKLTLNGAEVSTLKETSTSAAKVNFSSNGQLVSYSYTDTETDWESTDLGLIVKSDLARTYAGSVASPKIVSRSRMLVSYINK